MPTPPFQLIMISAMYENGGNTTHRLLDGHPELFVYPFESQVGTKFVNDHLASLYPLKYRWPIFPSSATAEEMYEQIIDEEGKVRAKTPQVSKFRTADFQMSDQDRKHDFVRMLKGRPLSRPNVMAAFFQATFTAWKNHRKSGKEECHVGYSPIIGIDGDKIIGDFPGKAWVLHVVRNPFSAYADTKKRAVPLSLAHYLTGWVMCQYHAMLFAKKYPDNFFIMRFEDIIKNPERELGGVLGRMGFGKSKTLAHPSWNGTRLKEVYPWGTIRVPTEAMNLKTAQELSPAEIAEIHRRTQPFLELLGYEEVYRSIR
jgi:hypothetical protein